MQNISPNNSGYNAPLDDAIGYARRGWRVLPLHTVRDDDTCSCRNSDCNSPGKHPRTKHGVNDASTDLGVIREWWRRWPNANIGVATGRESGVVVLDRDGPEGKASLAEFAPIEPTPVSQTGRGRHYWFRYPTTPLRSATRLRPGIDVKAAGGFVVAPPSRHATGKRYRWISSPDHVELAGPPRWLLQLLSDDQAQRAACNTIDKIIAGERNKTLFRRARSLHAKGFSPEAITAALRADNQERCEPPLPESEVEDIARKAATQPDRSDFRRTEPHEDFSEPVSTLLGEPDTPIEWLVEPLLATENRGFIGAEPKVGKSWLGLELGRCLASGAEFLGFSVPKKRRVLYIQEEDSRRRVLRRLRQLIQGSGDPDLEDDYLRVAIRKGFKIDQDKWREGLRNEIQRFRPEIVIFDVFNEIHTSDEQSQEKISAILCHFSDLRRVHPCAFIILHHFRKADLRGTRARSGQNLRGSSALHAWAENSLYLTWTGARCFDVEVESKDADCPPFAVEIKDTENGGVLLDAHPIAPSGSGKGEREWALVSAVFSTKKTITTLDAARVIKRDKKTAGKRLRKWVEQGRISEELLSTGGPNGTLVYRLVTKEDEHQDAKVGNVRT